MPKGLMKARLASRRRITRTLGVFLLEPEVEVSFLPGQHANLGIRQQGKLIQGDYSIVSSPHEDFLEFFIERVDDEHLTARLFQLELGAQLLIQPPKGRFLLDRESRRPHHLMIATVTGIAPFVSMVRSLAVAERRSAPPGIHMALLQGASYADEFGYDAELWRTAKGHSWLTYIPTVSRPSRKPGWHGEIGRVETLIGKTLDSLQWTPGDTTAYLCGHLGMIEKGKKILADRGFRRTQVREEQYWEEKP